MTVVPVAFQLASWIPPWWRGTVGGDDILALVGVDALSSVSHLRHTTVAVTAYCTDLGVGVLPGPKATTEAAVAAGEAVILHAAAGAPAHMLVPEDGTWHLLVTDPTRPLDLDVDSADAGLAQAVVAAEHALRAVGTSFSASPRTATARPLPPDADPRRRGLLVRAVRLWTAVSALPASQRLPELAAVNQAAAHAALAAYCAQSVIPAPDSARVRRKLA
ncbi:MAG: hypothetical protein R2720_09440 [Candidatus Nanopelagicales bacterium]